MKYVGKTPSAATDLVLFSQVQNKIGLPSYAPASAKNSYDPRRGIYNLKGSNTKRLRKALATMSTGGVAEVVAIGDSFMSQSYNGSTYANANDWPAYARTRLNDLGAPIAGTGLVRLTQGSSGTGADPRWAVGNVNNWNYQQPDAYTLTTGETATFTSDRAGDTIDILWYDRGSNTGDTTTVSVNGATTGTGFTTLTSSSNSSAVYRKYTLNASIAVGQTIKLTNTNGLMAILGIQVRRSSGGLLLHNIAQGGAYAAGTNGPNTVWSDTSGGGTTASLYYELAQPFGAGTYGVGTVAPGAVLIGLGSNDIDSGISNATVIAGIQTIAGLYTNSDVILVAEQGDSQTSDATWQSFVAQLYTLADSLDVPLIDHYALTGTYSSANGLGLTVDGLGHMTPMGNAFLATSFVSVLTTMISGNQATAPSLAIVTGTTAPSLVNINTWYRITPASATTVSIPLPAKPANNARIVLENTANVSSSLLTYVRSGSDTIEGSTNTFTLQPGEIAELSYENSNASWYQRRFLWSNTAGTTMRRDANGRAQVANPSATSDIANKTYVDTAIAAFDGGTSI